ncbi:MAG: CBS domain-containing protein [Pseudomonadota bacterium]|nr:CBS domain-containing protein [Pseudomonadota bacterium]
MRAGNVCTHTVAVVDGNTTVMDAARRMRGDHVGDLVVVEDRAGRLLPVGILTDRDIVVGLVARGLEGLDRLLVSDVIVRPLVTAHEDEDSMVVAKRMRDNGVRRVPVIDAKGELVGILSVDDLIGILHAELEQLAKLVGHQHQSEELLRP